MSATQTREKVGRTFPIAFLSDTKPMFYLQGSGISSPQPQSTVESGQKSIQLQLYVIDHIKHVKNKWLCFITLILHRNWIILTKICITRHSYLQSDFSAHWKHWNHVFNIFVHSPEGTKPVLRKKIDSCLIQKSPSSGVLRSAQNIVKLARTGNS